VAQPPDGWLSGWHRGGRLAGWLTPLAEWLLLLSGWRS
jgi:hypothetical protein